MGSGQDTGRADDQKAPEVSVVIPARNAQGMIKDQLEALTLQQTDRPFEVIVVVNGCTDRTEEEARSFSGRLNLRVIHSEPGYSSSRNAGALAARSHVVLFCDADDAATPTWVEALSSAVEKRHGIVGGFFGYRRFNTPGACRAYGFDPASPDGPEALMGEDEFKDARSVSGGNFGAWREDYLRVGGLDNSYRGGLEETDFCHRARQQGIPVVFCQDARIEVRLRSVASRAFWQQRGYAVNKILFVARTDREKGPFAHDVPRKFNVSFKWSLKALARSGAAALAYPVADPGRRIKILHDLGGHLGSVEGHLKYRVLGRVPPRRLLRRR